ncbi:DUF4440 domain-containing protein [Bosea sp. 685]|uniref:nuclear transport factor 2 family protein n=1 Tax=Bosea sp. 685 TaxID=3080057 RepID=UPI00289340DD|nr:DUF4440 domain-containing protein [Bosea sp. 685]WNJ89004.1 DUF4440 domain-containing protein [Bosea sp. 685]
MVDGGPLNAETESLLVSLRELEERLLMSQARASRADVMALLADDFVEFGRSGRIYDKYQTMEALAGETDQDASVERTARDFRVCLLAEGVALLTYRSMRRSTVDEIEVHSLRSSIWKLIDDSWQMVFHQGTPTRAFP